MDPIPSFTSKVVKEVPYPSDEESNGMVHIGWRGPQDPELSASSQLKAIFTIIVLMEYLTESAISPLKAAFVECDDPYAST